MPVCGVPFIVGGRGMGKLHVQEHYHLMKQINDLYKRKIITIDEFKIIMNILDSKM